MRLVMVDFGVAAQAVAESTRDEVEANDASS
jgi:hypothetical protein